MNVYDAALRKGDWMQTFTGKAFWPLDPRPEEVDIQDIAHALGSLCRYTGHCADFYSVAEHSVEVSHLVPPSMALTALLHDAPEAYCNDIARPLKRHMPEYKGIENRIWDAVADRFGLAREMPPEIHAADNAILGVEIRHLMKAAPEGLAWGKFDNPAVDTSGVLIQCLEPRHARRAFLRRYNQLTKRTA